MPSAGNLSLMFCFRSEGLKESQDKMAAVVHASKQPQSLNPQEAPTTVSFCREFFCLTSSLVTMELIQKKTPRKTTLLSP